MKCNRDCFNCVYDDCIEGNAELRTRYENRRAWQRDYRRRKYAEAAAKGLCRSCFKRKATHGTLCEACHARFKKYRMHADISKRKEGWAIGKEAAPFVDALIEGEFAATTVYSYYWAVENFFSMFDEVTAENMEAWKRHLLGKYTLKTANNKLSAMNQYCDFVGKPECRVKAEPKSRKRDDLQRLTNSTAAGASILEA